jgi:hypothetical protein
MRKRRLASQVLGMTFGGIEDPRVGVEGRAGSRHRGPFGIDPVDDFELFARDLG